MMMMMVVGLRVGGFGINLDLMSSRVGDPRGFAVGRRGGCRRGGRGQGRRRSRSSGSHGCRRRHWSRRSSFGTKGSGGSFLLVDAARVVAVVVAIGLLVLLVVWLPFEFFLKEAEAYS